MLLSWEERMEFLSVSEGKGKMKMLIRFGTDVLMPRFKRSFTTVERRHRNIDFVEIESNCICPTKCPR